VHLEPAPGKLFYMLVIRLLNEYFLKSYLHLRTSNLRLFPLVL